ncbi:MAG TPA: AraC family transcriptional regulator, partial [Usitatibacter sp.]|nr:AraC family transcriptional regulator [Usitatibacter sp.]
GAEVRLKPRLEALPGSVSVQMLRVLRALRDETLDALDLESAAWELCGDASRDRAVVERTAPRWLARLRAIVEETYAEPLTVRRLARELDLHPVHVAREFRRRHGLTVGEYVNQVRVRAASRAMAARPSTVAEVAHATGFSDHAHFCRVFRRAMGCTPSAFLAAISS